MCFLCGALFSGKATRCLWGAVPLVLGGSDLCGVRGERSEAGAGLSGAGASLSGAAAGRDRSGWGRSGWGRGSDKSAPQINNRLQT